MRFGVRHEYVYGRSRGKADAPARGGVHFQVARQEHRGAVDGIERDERFGDRKLCGDELKNASAPEPRVPLQERCGTFR